MEPHVRRYSRIGLVQCVSPLLALLLSGGCGSDSSGPEGDDLPDVDRLAAIPPDAEKVTPDTDPTPPILHSDEFHTPAPLPIISTAGGEDAPFITPDGSELYFFFVADVREDHSVQIRDPVNGIWVSRRSGGVWREPRLVWLQDYDELALNGCPWVGEDEMLFCSARAGVSGVQWFRASRAGIEWEEWELATFPPALEVGELHIHGQELYYGSSRPGGAGGQDIWVATKQGATWADATNVQAVNTSADETRPFVTADGQELWLTRWHEGSPALVRSRKVGGVWQEGEIIVSRFAGEPTLDPEGNLYFVHHFYDDGVMQEVDIYVALRR